MILNRTVSTWIFVALALVASGTLIAAEADASKEAAKPQGFRFKGGDPEVGQKSFVILSCIECHSVKGVKIERPPQERVIDLPLAAETRFVKSYEDIILAITSPRHVINEQYRAILKAAELKGEIEPLMPDLTDRMSASQLMDLTAFLHRVYSRELSGYGDSKGE